MRGIDAAIAPTGRDTLDKLFRFGEHDARWPDRSRRPRPAAHRRAQPRHGVSPDLLRAWERRYGLLRARALAGGFRLYTSRDEARVRAMRRGLAQGLSAVRGRADGPARAAPPAGAERARARWRRAGRARRGARVVPRRRRPGGARPAVRHLQRRDGAARRRAAVPARRRRPLGGGRAVGRAGALRQRHHPRPPARAWRAAGTPASARGRCSPARRRAARPRPACASGWRCASTAGASPTSAPTRPSTPCATTAADLDPAVIVICAEREGPMRGRDRRDRAARAGASTVALAGRGATAEQAHRAGARLLQDAPIAAAARMAEGRCDRRRRGPLAG